MHVWVVEVIRGIGSSWEVLEAYLSEDRAARVVEKLSAEDFYFLSRFRKYVPEVD